MVRIPLAIVGAMASLAAATVATAGAPVTVKTCNWDRDLTCTVRLSDRTPAAQTATLSQKVLFKGASPCDRFRSLSMELSGGGRQTGPDGATKGLPRLALTARVVLKVPGFAGQSADTVSGTVRSGDRLTERLARDVVSPTCRLLVEVTARARQVPVGSGPIRFDGTGVSVQLSASQLP